MNGHDQHIRKAEAVLRAHVFTDHQARRRILPSQLDSP